MTGSSRAIPPPPAPSSFLPIYHNGRRSFFVEEMIEHPFRDLKKLFLRLEVLGPISLFPRGRRSSFSHQRRNLPLGEGLVAPRGQMARPFRRSSSTFLAGDLKFANRMPATFFFSPLDDRA